MKLSRLIFSSVFSMLATSVLACSEYQPLERAQVTELMNIVSSNDANPLEQVFAFETLACSDQASIRDITMRIGIESNNPTIRAQVAFRAVFELETIVFKLLDVEGLTKEHYETIRNFPTYSVPLYLRDVKNGCRGLWSADRECNPNRVFSITGLQAALSLEGTIGTFDVQGNKLVGKITFRKPNLTFPVEAVLF